MVSLQWLDCSVCVCLCQYCLHNAHTSGETEFFCLLFTIRDLKRVYKEVVQSHQGQGILHGGKVGGRGRGGEGRGRKEAITS